MNKKNSLMIKRMVGISVLAALVIVLQLISNHITFGNISITLALIPIAMGAILYGPITGMILGIIMGLMVLIAPSTGVFFSVSPLATIIICLLKTGIAGLISGYIFRLFSLIANSKEKKIKYYFIGIVTSAIVVPIINTGLFIIGATLLFKSLFGNFVGVINAVLTTNFLFEFLVSIILSPTLNYLVKILTVNSNLGFNEDLNIFDKDNLKII